MIASKNAQIKRMACDHAASVKRIKILEKQKIAVAKVVNDLEVKRLMERAVDHHQHLNTTSYSGEATDALVSSINCIPESHMTPYNSDGKVIGSGSYGTCELMHWRNIPVCVKKTDQKAELSEVKREAAILHQLQQSLFVPVLLGINFHSTSFYIVTKFHSASADTSLTLHTAINKCVIKKSKWASI